MIRALRHLRPAPRAFLFALIAAALFARLLVPQGWMPAIDGSGRLTICSGMGPMEMPAEAKALFAKAMQGAGQQGGHDKGHDLRAGDHPCVFSVLGFSLLGEALAGLDTPLFVSFTAAIRPSVLAAPGRGLAAPPPPATGPPIS